MGRILIVEDDTTLSQAVGVWLTNEKHEVDIVADGNDATKRLSEADYDLLILDWDLPNKSGIDICIEYRGGGGEAAVLMLTGREAILDKERGLDAGADDYLTKPFAVKEFAARVRALLRRTEKKPKKKALPKIAEMMVCPLCGSSYAQGITVCPGCSVFLKKREIDESIGTIIGGRYEILSLIAHGGNGSVYLARQTLMKRTVAVKLLSASEENSTRRKRFEREGETTGRLDHPNIATVHDFGITDDDRPFMVMAYIDGCSLSELLEIESVLEWGRAVRIFKQILEGLDHAHKQGVIHRDLKPANIMLEHVGTERENVKLVDFGIAKLKPLFTDEVEKLTQDGTIFGTTRYMSPEQCLGKEPDERSDIYALGCVMYEVVTGQPPIPGTNVLETIQSHLYTVPPTCRQARPDLDLPGELDAIICRCLAKMQDKRYQSARELASALERLVSRHRQTSSAESGGGKKGWRRFLPW